MYENSTITNLIKKKIEGIITAEELIVLNDLAKKHPAIDKLMRMVENNNRLLEDAAVYLDLSMDQRDRQDRLLQKTLSKINKKPSKITLFRRYLPYVAVFFVLSFCTFFYYKLAHQTSKDVLIEDLAPGKNMASITLSDGRVIELSQDQYGVVLGDQLKYEDGTMIQDLRDEELTFATIATPKGGQYQITLSDGTKVWLNADSKLTYPIRFKAGNREVSLAGEAYFDVMTIVKNGVKNPFTIKTDHQLVNVLGTEFNLKAYPDEQFNTQTTLVEGSVSLQTERGNLILEPGEQGVLGKQSLSKRKVDTNLFTSWKENKFVFEEMELHEALTILSRWYDFDFIIENSVKPIHLYASISRNKSLKEVLSILESSDIKFRLEKKEERNKLMIYN